MKQLSILFFASVIFTFSSCELDKFVQGVLDSKIETWKNQNISDYEYKYGEACFCSSEEDILVTVVNNQVTAAFYTPSGDEITGVALSEVLIIDDFFDLVQDAIDDNVFFINIQYHITYGFPEILDIDPDEGIADDEVVYTINNFTF